MRSQQLRIDSRNCPPRMSMQLHWATWTRCRC